MYCRLIMVLVYRVVVFLTVTLLLQHATLVQMKEEDDDSSKEEDEELYENMNETLQQPDSSPNNDPGTCVFELYDKESVNATLMNFIANGSHLIRYNITIINGSSGDDGMWRADGDIVYKPTQWTRIGSAHGKVLLALVFNYETVSVRMLSFGLMDMDITVTEHGCYSDAERTIALRQFVYDDFNLHRDHRLYREICNSVIISEFGSVRFGNKCYRMNELGQLVGVLIVNKWIDMLHVLLQIVRIFIILFGPLLFQSWVYEGDLQSTVPYVVHLEQDKPENRNTENEPMSIEEDNPLLSLLSPLKDDVDKASVCEIDVPANTRSIHLVVDHTKLMSQSTVPVNVFSFIMGEFIGCGLMERFWLKSCTAAGCLFGTCTKNFRSSKFPPHEPSWGQVFTLVNSVIVGLLLVPLPFHIRVAVYLYTEAREMLDREKIATTLGYNKLYYESLWLGVYWPTIIFIIYSIYVVSLAVYAFAQSWVYHQFDDIIQDCIFDLRDNSYESIFGMLFYHLVMPFKKFGFLIGLFVAVPYYIVMLPVASCVAIFYGIPTLYIIGRLFCNLRPTALSKPISCCGKRMKVTSLLEMNEKVKYESTNVSLSEIFALNQISTDSRQYRRPPSHRIKKNFKNMFKARISEVFLSLFVSLATVFLMLTLVLMYAEALRFFLHMLLLALAGLVLNAKHTMDYFILLFWTGLYCARSIQSVHSKYNQMSQKVFGFLKDHLFEKVADATRVKEEFQMCTAFKYFGAEDLENIANTMNMYIHEEGEMISCDTRDRLVKNRRYNTVEWDAHALVLFVDKYDMARIPRRLFWRICERLRAPGCPGPLQHSICEALKQLLSMLTFLFIIYIIIMSFNEVFDRGSNNQLLVTVAGGFLPLIIRTLIPRNPSVDLSEYSLKGKIEEILLDYRERWPVEEERVHCDGQTTATFDDRSQKSSMVDLDNLKTSDLNRSQKSSLIDLENLKTSDLNTSSSLLRVRATMEDNESLTIEKYITKEPLLTFGWSWKERTTVENRLSMISASRNSRAVEPIDHGVTIVVDAPL